MVLALADKWIWDFWLAEDGGDWHAYFLQADNTLANPDMRLFREAVIMAASLVGEDDLAAVEQDAKN